MAKTVWQKRTLGVSLGLFSERAKRTWVFDWLVEQDRPDEAMLLTLEDPLTLNQRNQLVLERFQQLAEKEGRDAMPLPTSKKFLHWMEYVREEDQQKPDEVMEAPSWAGLLIDDLEYAQVNGQEQLVKYIRVVHRKHRVWHRFTQLSGYDEYPKGPGWYDESEWIPVYPDEQDQETMRARLESFQAARDERQKREDELKTWLGYFHDPSLIEKNEAEYLLKKAAEEWCEGHPSVYERPRYRVMKWQDILLLEVTLHQHFLYCRKQDSEDLQKLLPEAMQRQQLQQKWREELHKKLVSFPIYKTAGIEIWPSIGHVERLIQVPENLNSVNYDRKLDDEYQRLFVYWADLRLWSNETLLELAPHFRELTPNQKRKIRETLSDLFYLDRKVPFTRTQLKIALVGKFRQTTQMFAEHRQIKQERQEKHRKRFEQAIQGKLEIRFATPQLSLPQRDTDMLWKLLPQLLPLPGFCFFDQPPHPRRYFIDASSVARLPAELTTIPAKFEVDWSEELS